MYETLQAAMFPVHREGYRFIAIAVVVTLLLFLVSEVLGWTGVLATVWVVFFFRDPERVTPVREGLVVAPADGIVESVELALPPPELGMPDGPRLRIATFMNVFDVHVNRVPADGEVVRMAYRPGKFINAKLDKASDENERQAILLRTAEGRDLAVVQIAGLVARRIVCAVYEGERVRAGERLGMIRFGSRVDVYLDHGMAPMVMVGQRMVAGETVLADGRSVEPARRGEVR